MSAEERHAALDLALARAQLIALVPIVNAWLVGPGRETYPDEKFVTIEDLSFERSVNTITSWAWI